MSFGVLGWIVKGLAWPRPPLVVGLVIGAIFERYLYISSSLYGLAWLTRPVVLVILALVACALYRPLSEIVRSVMAELRQSASLPFRLPSSSPSPLALVPTI